MTLKAGVGVSHARDPERAGREAATEAMRKANSSRPDFTFVFATAGHDQQAVLSAVRAATDNSALCGCSSEGVISTGVADEGNYSVAVMAVESPDVRFRPFTATGLKADSEGAGRRLAEQIRPHLTSDAQALFVFPDGLTCNWDRLHAGLHDGLAGTGKFLPMFGGFSGDAMEFRKTHQYFNDQVASDSISVALMSGPVKLSSAINSGCVAIGRAHTITKAEGNQILEIDGRRATDVLREYVSHEDFDNWTRSAILVLTVAFKATGVVKQELDDFVIRYIPAKDDAKGSFTLPTEIPTGTQMWLTHRDGKMVTSGVERVARQLSSDLAGEKPKIVFQFDCAGRGKWILSEDEKLDAVKKLQHSLGEDVPWLGFYTFGEIGPVGESNHFHNYTVVILTVH